MLVDSEPTLANVPVDKREQFVNCFVGHFKTQFNNRIDIVFDAEKVCACAQTGTYDPNCVNRHITTTF